MSRTLDKHLTQPAAAICSAASTAEVAAMSKGRKVTSIVRYWRLVRDLSCTLMRLGKYGVEDAKLMTPQEVADFKDCTNVTVLRHIAAGRLHAIRIGGNEEQPKMYAVLLGDAKRWKPGRRDEED